MDLKTLGSSARISASYPPHKLALKVTGVGGLLEAGGCVTKHLQHRSRRLGSSQKGISTQKVVMPSFREKPLEKVASHRSLVLTNRPVAKYFFFFCNQLYTVVAGQASERRG